MLALISYSLRAAASESSPGASIVLPPGLVTWTDGVAFEIYILVGYGKAFV